MNTKNSGFKRNCATGVFAAVAASAICPVPAFAAEGIGAIMPVMDEFLPMLVAFILLWIVLAKFGWPLFDKMLVKRENTIKDSLEKSEAARQESERLLAEYKEQLEGAKTQSAAIIANAQKTGDAMKAEITERAQEEAASMITKAKAAIETEKKAAMEELQGSMADTTVLVATKLIGEDFSDEDHRKLIERYLNEAGSFNAN